MPKGKAAEDSNTKRKRNAKGRNNIDPITAGQSTPGRGGNASKGGSPKSRSPSKKRTPTKGSTTARSATSTKSNKITTPPENNKRKKGSRTSPRHGIKGADETGDDEFASAPDKEDGADGASNNAVSPKRRKSANKKRDGLCTSPFLTSPRHGTKGADETGDDECPSAPGKDDGADGASNNAASPNRRSERSTTKVVKGKLTPTKEDGMVVELVSVLSPNSNSPGIIQVATTPNTTNAVESREDGIGTPSSRKSTGTPIQIPTPSHQTSRRVSDAWQCIQRNCGARTCEINNTMWLYLWPLYVDEKDNLVVSMVDCNWNAWDSKVALEVTLNILANADGKHTKLHEPNAGDDMSVLMAHVHEVSNCTVIIYILLIFTNVFHYISQFLSYIYPCPLCIFDIAIV